MITLAAAALLGIAQQSGEAVVAQINENPETWVLEYPIAARPFVYDYYDCLKSRNHVIGNGVGFADQHRGDIPKCVEAEAETVARIEALISRFEADGGAPLVNAHAIVETIQQIHIARGRDLDRQLALRLGQPPTYYSDHNPARPATNEADESGAS